MKKRFKINTDRLLAFFAFIISLFTLYVFFQQTSLMKKQQYASVLPYFAIGNTQVNGDYSFILENNGIGPGFIDEMNIHYKDSVYKNMDLNNFFIDVILKQDSLLNSSNITHATIRKGMLIPEKEIKYMIRLNNSDEDFEMKHYRLRQWFNEKIKVEIKYSSIYGEKWKIIYPEIDIPLKLK